MPPESRKLLLDMLNSANLIRDFIADKSFNDFAQDQMRRAAVYYHFPNCRRGAFATVRP